MVEEKQILSPRELSSHLTRKNMTVGDLLAIFGLEESRIPKINIS